MWTKLGKLKPLYAFIDCVEEHHSESDYYLRYSVGKDHAYEHVGKDIRLLLATKMRREAEIIDGTITKPSRRSAVPFATLQPVEAEPIAGDRHPLLQCIRAYLTEKKAHRPDRTYLAYSQAWDLFLKFLTLPQYKNELSYDRYTLREDASKDLTPAALAHLSLRYLKCFPAQTSETPFQNVIIVGSFWLHPTHILRKANPRYRFTESLY